MQIITNAEKGITISLSRRNLTHLIAALDYMGGTHEPTLHRLTEGNVHLLIVAQEDEDHYGDRKRGQGFEFLMDEGEEDVD